MLFPLPYDNSPTHNESWEKAKAYVGKRVEVVLHDGRTITGTVVKYEVSTIREQNLHGVGFTVRSGSPRFPYDTDVRADMQSITILD